MWLLALGRDGSVSWAAEQLLGWRLCVKTEAIWADTCWEFCPGRAVHSWRHQARAKQSPCLVSEPGTPA